MKCGVGRVLITIALAFQAGCTDTFRPFAILGTYDLTTFAGSPLPGTIAIGNGGSMRVDAGILSLTGGGRYEMTVDRELCVTPVQCVEETVVETGTYDAMGDNLRLIMDDGGALDGRFRGNRIMLNDSDPPSVWLRRNQPRPDGVLPAPIRTRASDPGL